MGRCPSGGRSAEATRQGAPGCRATAPPQAGRARGAPLALHGSEYNVGCLRSEDLAATSTPGEGHTPPPQDGVTGLRDTAPKQTRPKRDRIRQTAPRRHHGPPRLLPNAVSKPDRLHLHTRLSPWVSSPCESTAGDPFPLANLGALRADPVHTSGRRRVPESRTVSNLLSPSVSPRSLPIARCLYLEAVQGGPGIRPPPRSSPSCLRQT